MGQSNERSIFLHPRFATTAPTEVYGCVLAADGDILHFFLVSVLPRNTAMKVMKVFLE